jgi:glutaredoxin
MSRLLLSAVAGLLIAGAAAPSFAGDATTTRIEPRPFYGATVTLEAGVRVFRPLPPTKRVIINPNGTPLNLSQTDVDVDVDVKETRNVYHHGNSHQRTAPYVVYGGIGTYARGFRRGKHGGYRARRHGGYGRSHGVRAGH